MKSTPGKTSSQTIQWLAWIGAGRVVLMFVSVASVAILARLLTQADYGVFAASMIFIGVVRSGLLNGGFPTAAIQRQELTPHHIRNAYTGMLLLHIVAAALIWAVSGLIAAFFAMPELSLVLDVLCLTVLLNPILAMSIVLLKRRKQFRLLAQTDVVSSIFANTAVAIALALAGFGVWSLVIANVAWIVVQTLIVFGLAPFNLVPTITWHMRDLLKTSMGFSLLSVLSVLSGQIARFVVGRSLGADALGVFSRANRVLDFPKTLVGSSYVLFPVFADMNDDKVRLSRGYLRSIALCTLAGAPLTVLVCHEAEGLILLLLGQQWEAAIVPTAVLSLTLVLALGTRVAIAVLTAVGHVRALLLRQIVFAVLILAGTIIGSNWGLVGVCVAIVFTSLISCGLTVGLSNRFLMIDLATFAKVNLPGLLLALLVLAVLLLGDMFVWSDAHVTLQFPIQAVASVAAVYVACMVKPPWFLGQHGLWLMGELRGKISQRLRFLLPGT